MKNEKIEKDIKFYEKNDQIWRTLLRGVQDGIRSYQYSKESNYEYIVIDDLWEKDADDIIRYLREKDVKEFIFDDHSTEAMRVLKRFIKKNCIIKGVVMYKNEEYDKKEGILIEL